MPVGHLVSGSNGGPLVCTEPYGCTLSPCMADLHGIYTPAKRDKQASRPGLGWILPLRDSPSMHPTCHTGPQTAAWVLVGG